SYLIKDGQVRTHGTPVEIVHDSIAISEYLGTEFSTEGIVGRTAVPPRLGPQEPVVVQASEPEVSVHSLLEHEKIHRLIEALRTGDPDAVAELCLRGPVAVPALLEALERRDVEMRCRALHVLQTILGDPVAFDPYAPEAQRRQQLVEL